MCLILLAWQAHPGYPLVLAANRDEFHRRPTAAAQWWPAPPLLAGRDLEAGGTWLGISHKGRWAALTNYRDPGRHRDNARSRGELAVQWLQQTESIEQALSRLVREHDSYNHFNMLFGDAERAAVFESMPGSGRELASGVYGLSNDLLDTPWPKVRQAKSQLSAALEHLPDQAALLALLRDDRPAADHELPRTGVSLEWERLLSSAFIRAPGYGTRCSTIVVIDRDQQAQFAEWSWNAMGTEQDRRQFSFRIERHQHHGQE